MSSGCWWDAGVRLVPEKHMRSFLIADECHNETELRNLLDLSLNDVCADMACHSTSCSYFVVEEKSGEDTRNAVRQLTETCKAVQRLGWKVEACILVAPKVNGRFFTTTKRYLYYLHPEKKMVRILNTIRVMVYKPHELTGKSAPRLTDFYPNSRRDS